MIESAWRQVLVPIAVLFVLSGCASTASQRLADGGTATFPEPAAIADNVAFWRNVYGTWGRGDVAIHDDEHLGVVYEVARLPGPIGEGYDAAQRELVQARKAHYQWRLARLQEKVAAGQGLDREERALREKLVAAGGQGAIVGASQRVRSQRGLRERFRRGLEISGRYEPAFREIMRLHGVPEDLAFLPHVESSYQVHARSAVGAAGVWQFMPATGRQFMTVTPAVDERLDPVIAADAAARYLRDAYGRLGSWPLAITSYNHGVGGMQRAKAAYGTDFGAIAEHYDGPAFGFSSRNFYACFLAAREVASAPERYFPEGIRRERPLDGDRLVLRQSLPASDVARHYGLSLQRLGALNLAWRDPVLAGRATLPAGSTVWLPAGSLQRVAGHPQPSPVLVAQAMPATATRKVMPAVAQPKAPAKVAAVAKPAAAKPRAATVKHHVVKPQETLYRVALQYELSVDELRRLNQIAPNDNTIRPGQRLRVSS
ncbi:lytic transglycosylase domain-containing protein [Thiococcus pfennigii]|uniref:lytic transglycosylase domain-containing protein n=1 Tax=Thiococcus pfennigii TaxID=1057 RepID=UPI001903888A|nr:lytic transglycosylase domain-containing protein [Thiococcus pfennigii]MBK1701887.1 lytic transglycosylase [Thiococcus pfennigii]